MTEERPIRRAAEPAIWAASGLLAVALGLGAALALRTTLHRAADPKLAGAAVEILSLGLILIGVALERPLARTALIVFALALLLGFSVAGSGLVP